MLGLRQQQAVLTTLQAHRNADTNARRITLGQIQSAKPIPRFQTAQDFLQTHSGTLFQLFRRHGTEQAGNLQQRVLTTQLQALPNADTNANRVISGMDHCVKFQYHSEKYAPTKRLATTHHRQ